jgi:hypothetical protein
LEGLALSHNLHNSEAMPIVRFYKKAAIMVLSLGIISGGLWGLSKLTHKDSD